MNDAIEMNIRGIQCDNPKCDFRDMNVKYEDHESWLNKPCPKCGENLLTEKDYKSCKRLIKAIRFFNKIFPRRKEDDEIVTITVTKNKKAN